MSDTSPSLDAEKDNKEEIKYISDEAALRELLQSESEDEDEIKKEDNNDATAEGVKIVEPSEEKHIKQEPNADLDGSLSELSSDDDSDIDESKINSVVFMKKANIKQEPDLPSKSNSQLKQLSSSSNQAKTNNSRANVKTTTTSSAESEAFNIDRQNLKRKVSSDVTSSSTTAKRPCANDSSLDIEEMIRRYLMRKPMTTKAILQKLKKNRVKGSGGNKNELEVVKIAEIIRKINPEKQLVNKELLLFIRAP